MTGTEFTLSVDVGHLIALADRLAAEGRMNLNKLIEAAVFAEERRAAWRHRPRITPETMAEELGKALEELARSEAPAGVIAALQAGRRLLDDGNGGDLSIEDAPDPYVCRTCGYVALGGAPRECPECGAWSGRFRRFVAVFNGDNQEPTDPMAVIELLAQNAEALARLVDGLTEEQMAERPSGADWSIRDHIAHFYDTQEMLDTRVELMLRQDEPRLTAVAPYEFATDEERHPKTALGILGEFRERRMRLVARLESLPLKDLWRAGLHPEFGRVTILRQAAYMAYHEQTHLPEIQALRREVSGPSLTAA